MYDQEMITFNGLKSRDASASSGRKGFTLIEMLVVIAIIAILISLGFTQFSSARARALEAETSSRLRQVFLGFQSYALENRLQYPRFYNPGDENPQIWQARIAPFIGITDWRPEYQSMRQMVFNSPYQEEDRNRPPWQVGRSFGVNNFLAHPNWNFQSTLNPRPTQIVLVGDMMQSNSDFVNTADGHNWYSGGNAWARPAFRHRGGRAFFIFADGHVESLAEEQLWLNPSDSPSPWMWW
jgi:prepilin-type N-terminal cleavage/methylation domain-containing protein/prepilin-type processing-associated H-X9-DG protein